MSRAGYQELAKSRSQEPRDSLELASLASSSSAPASGRSSLVSSPSGISSSRKLSFDDDPLSDSNPANRSSTRMPHGRSYSVSSAFDFASNLFPLSSTQGGYAPLGVPSTVSLDRHNGLGDGSLEKIKSLTYLNGLSLVIGLIIGSGIFSSPTEVNPNSGSPGASLIVWTVAGLLAWTGAASYAELGGAIPLNGGAQVYLSKIFGEMIGFLFTWSAVCVLKPGGAAIVAIIFGEYTVRAFVGADVEDINPWINKGVAIGALVLVTIFNCVSTKLGTRLSDLFMFFKFVALIGVTIIGIVVAITGYSFKGQASDDWKNTGWFDNTSHDISGWARALYAALWAFDGWDNTNYVTGEFKNPSRDLPRVIHTAMPLVIVSYLLANVSYFFVLPLKVIKPDDTSKFGITIAVKFGSEVFGPIGGLILALTVSATCFGTLNASTFTSGRLVYVAGKEGYLPAMFGKLGIAGSADTMGGGGSGSRLRRRPSAFTRAVSRFVGDDHGIIGFTPINAMLLNGALCACYVAVGEFRTLITFYGVAGYFFYFLTVLGLVVLRVREPYLERPYRTWITTPIIFCCVSLFLLSRTIFVEPLQTVVVLAFVGAGVPVYFWTIARRDGPGGGGEWMRFWRRWGRSG